MRPGQPWFGTVRLDIDLDAGLMSARGNLPGGYWSARVAMDGWAITRPLAIGWVRTHDDLELTKAQKAELVDMLRLILHRVRGPINLLGGGEEIVEVQEVFVAGYDAIRMTVSGRPEEALGYFFADGQLRMVTQGAIEPGQQGKATVYTTQRTVSGAIQPAGFEVMLIGRDSLIGRQKIMSVRLTDMTFD